MFRNLTQRTAHKNWHSALLLFTLVAMINFAAAFLKSIALNFVGLASFALVSLYFVRKSNWRDINIKKPSHVLGIFWGLICAALFVVGNYVLLHFTVGNNSANYFVITAKSQLSYGVINKFNAWQFFPIAAIGFSTISPLTEELFFRGVLLKSLESRFSALKANVIQGILFGLFIWRTCGSGYSHGHCSIRWSRSLHWLEFCTDGLPKKQVPCFHPCWSMLFIISF
ncbi:CPBP family intramembrane metalloprotease [bacterium]|nr:CPBP family intramembrane metalloprotease [bacterium]